MKSYIGIYLYLLPSAKSPSWPHVKSLARCMRYGTWSIVRLSYSLFQVSSTELFLGFYSL